MSTWHRRTGRPRAAPTWCDRGWPRRWSRWPRLRRGSGVIAPGGIHHGRTGLVCSSPDEWAAALDQLVGDAALRARLGAAARRQVELHHSPHLTARRYRDAFDALDDRRAVGRRELRRATSAPPVCNSADDDRSAVALASYDLGAASIGDAVVTCRRPSDTARSDTGRRNLVGRLGGKVRRTGSSLRRRVLPR